MQVFTFIYESVYSFILIYIYIKYPKACCTRLLTNCPCVVLTFNFLLMESSTCRRLEGLLKGVQQKKPRHKKAKSSLKDKSETSFQHGELQEKGEFEGLIWWQHIHMNNSSSVAWIHTYKHTYICTCMHEGICLRSHTIHVYE